MLKERCLLALKEVQGEATKALTWPEGSLRYREACQTYSQRPIEDSSRAGSRTLSVMF